MASGQVLKSLQSYCNKAEKEMQSWKNAQERLCSVLGTSSNILERIPALQDDANYGQLSSVPNFRKQLVSKQLMALEDLLGDAQSVLKTMAEATSALQKISNNAKSTIQQDKRLTPGARKVSLGPIPSVDHILNELNEIGRMHADEQRLQEVLSTEVRYGRTALELQEVLLALRTKPNIDEKRIHDFLRVMEFTMEESKG